MTRALVVVLAVMCALAPVATAHELRPAYLELRETAPGEYDVLWKTPMVGEARHDLVPEFPDGARDVARGHAGPGPAPGLEDAAGTVDVPVQQRRTRD